MKKTIIISAGGTGGHIFPALAVAKELSSSYNIVWVGGKTGLENNLVPEHGYTLKKVAISGVRNKGILRKLILPWILFKAFCQSLIIILRYNPKAVIGFGGYATFPICVCARILLRPVLIHEQNSVAGLSNRIIAKFATRVLTAFPGVLPSTKTVLVGNPVRNEIINIKDRVMGHDPNGRLKILVIGGSLGAKALNDIVPLAIAKVCEHVVSVTHQVGRGSSELVKEVYSQYQITANVVNFIQDIASEYAKVDLVICRAGASTVAEIAAAGCAAIFVPYPHAVDDHQTSNAEYLTTNQAAFLIPQDQLDPNTLANLLTELDPSKCQDVASRAKKLAITDATHRILNELQQVIR